MLNSLISAFLMYSRIPMPQIPWEERSRRYALCFFPLIGAVIGGMLIGWGYFCRWIGISELLFAGIAVCIPVLVTGGIHLDGFCDVEDALASFAEKQRRLEIMSDPHVGSFAVLHLVLYLLLQFVLFTQIRDIREIFLIACGYILSRTLSALAAVTFKCAKKNGTLQDFVKPAHRRNSIITLSMTLLLVTAGMLAISPIPSIAALLLAAVMFLRYRAFSYKTFGGITGDTAGWFLQKCEIWVLFGIVMTTILTQRL